MGLLESLLHSYDNAESIGMVDDHNRNPVLLPLYHTSLRSKGDNCIRAYLRKNGELFKAEFIPEDETIIFPITEKSIVRSGRKAPAHPLVDKLNYLAFYNKDNHAMYKEEFEQWYRYEKARGGNAFLEAINQFYQNTDWVHDLIEHLFEGISYAYQAPQVTYEVVDKKGKTKNKTVDLSTVFLTFSVIDLVKDKEINVTENTELHKSYIRYVENLHTEKNICNITGKTLYCTPSHRGIIGNAKIISVSNNTETYYGRFKKGEDIVTIGYETSQNIHLMLKYLLDNENSCIWLGDTQYLVNWFSDDIANTSGLNPTLSVRQEVDDSTLEDEDWDLDEDI